MLMHLKKLNARIGHGGYLYEIPLLLFIIGVITLFLGNKIPSPWNKILYILLAVCVVFFLVYNFILNRRGTKK